MKRLLALAVAFYLPHLLEEALTGMHDDPLIVAAYAPLASLGPRHAAYLVFQVTIALGLLATVLFAWGGRPRRIVMAALALTLLAEGHHVVRALLTLHYDSGLLTSLPLPPIGAVIAARLWRRRAGASLKGTGRAPTHACEPPM